MRFYAFCTENTDPEIQGDIFMAKEMIAMLLAGGSGLQTLRADTEACKTGSSFRRKVSDHRLPALELCKFRNRYRWNSDPVPADGVE